MPTPSTQWTEYDNQVFGFSTDFGLNVAIDVKSTVFEILYVSAARAVSQLFLQSIHRTMYHVQRFIEYRCSNKDCN